MAHITTSHFLVNLVAFFSFLTLLPLLLLVYVLCYLYRIFVRFLVFSKYGNTVSLMDGLEAGWNAERQHSRSVITFLYVFEGEANINKIRKRFLSLRNGENACPKFFQTRHWEAGYYCWKDIPEHVFNIQDHVKVSPIQQATEEELMNYISSISNTPLGDTPDRSGWEAIVVPEVTDTDNSHKTNMYAIIVRCHHSLGYGNDFLRILVTNFSDEFVMFRGFTRVKQYPWTDAVQSVVSVIYAIIFGPYDLFQQLLRRDKNALHGPDLSGEKILLWVDIGKLKTLEKIRDITGANVNDIILSLVSSSLSPFLEPSDYFVSAVVPAIIDLPGIITPLAQKSKTDIVYSNNITGGLLTIPTPAGDCDPVERLNAVHKECDSLRRSSKFIVNYFTARVIWTLLPSVFAKLILSELEYTLCVSNLPGPEKTIKICGQKLRIFVFWIPTRGNTGLGVTVLSYDGRVRMGVIVDRAVLPKQEQAELLTKGLTTALDDLIAATGL